MLLSGHLASIAGLMCALSNAGMAFAQNYPVKPVRIVTSSVGGGGDLASRIIAQGVSAPLGQPIVVENRSASGAIEGVVKAPADGYNLLLTGSSFWIGPLLRKSSYDPVKDFAPVTMVSRAPLVLVVHPSLPIKSMKELIALAKARPGQLNYGSGSPGGGTHLAGELLKSMSGTNITNIPYKSDSIQLQDQLSGELQLAMSSATSVMDHLKSGRLRALAVTSAEPSALVPGLPTVASTVPGFVSVSMTGMFAPAGTPDAVIGRLNQEVVRYLKTSEARERFLLQGVETVGSSAQEMAAAMRVEMTRLGKVIKDANIRAD